MKRRTKVAVLRYPNFSTSTDDYYYTMLMLLLPHRNGDSLVLPFDNARDAFIGKYSDIDRNIAYNHMSFVENLENCIHRIRMSEAELAVSSHAQSKTSNCRFTLERNELSF